MQFFLKFFLNRLTEGGQDLSTPLFSFTKLPISGAQFQWFLGNRCGSLKKEVTSLGGRMKLLNGVPTVFA